MEDAAKRNRICVKVAAKYVTWFAAVFAAGVFIFARPVLEQTVDFTGKDLKLSPQGRYLMYEDGRPFFYLADTAWELFHRLTIEDTETYLDDRSRKGFTVVQAVLLAELDGLNTPNVEGDRPLWDNDPDKPNEAYFHHVDAVVSLAAARGMFIGMLPTWGDKVTKAWGLGPVVFNEENAKRYGKFLGAHYSATPNIIWILGGDRDPSESLALWRAMAAGLREGDHGRHLITYHPSGDRSSSQWFQKESWLDFNLIQSGHGRKDGPNFAMVRHDYNLSPSRPVIDGEPRYENHPVNWKPAEFGWFEDYDVRQAAYWAVFAGAAGHTYGCNDIWQMKTPDREPMSMARGTWQTSLSLPGSGQMKFLRALMESRPYFSRIPDPSLILDNPAEGPEHAEATRGDGYAFIYLPAGGPARIVVDKLKAVTLQAWWYDPRTGAAQAIGERKGRGTLTFTPAGVHSRGNDWVLVLDDAARNFSAPGQAMKAH